MRAGERESAVSGTPRERRGLKRRALSWVTVATILSVASVLLLFPFFAMPGAEVNSFTTALLGAQCALLILWARTCGAYAASKGYRISKRGFSTIVSTLFIAMLLLTLRTPLTHEVQGRTLYTPEGALTYLVLGLAGALGPIVVAFLPDRWRSEPPVGTAAPLV